MRLVLKMFNKITLDRDNARKEKDQFKLTVLSTFIGEIETKFRGKDSKDDLDTTVQKVLKSTIENCRELYKFKHEETILNEIKILEEYLIPDMSEEEILSILNENSFTELPHVMKHFKSLNKPVDMKQVRELFLKSKS